MRNLEKFIAAELRTAKHCAVYQEEINRVWPNDVGREQAIKKFAESHGWRLRFYQKDLVAIFDKAD